MGKPKQDLEIKTIKRLFEIDEILFKIDNPDHSPPHDLSSWKNITLTAQNVADWPNCVSSIMNIVKGTSVSDSCFDFQSKKNLEKIINHLSNVQKVCPPLGANSEIEQEKTVDPAELSIAELIEALKGTNTEHGLEVLN